MVVKMVMGDGGGDVTILMMVRMVMMMTSTKKMTAAAVESRVWSSERPVLLIAPGGDDGWS